MVNKYFMQIIKISNDILQASWPFNNPSPPLGTIVLMVYIKKNKVDILYSPANIGLIFIHSQR